MNLLTNRGLALAVAAAMLAAGPGRAADASEAIAASPAFSAKDLTALPTGQWITNGGNIFNQRYSPLTQLNRDNVKGLKGLWRTSMGSGANQGNSGQAQILVYQGALYVSNGDNDVFAMDVETGKTLWTYKANRDPKAGNPIGLSSRGVAMGEGKIFAGQIDSKLVALDQKTGKVLWSTQAEEWEAGFSITTAPLYYDGLVITGFNGGEMGTRGRVKAFDAKTGKLVWTFYTIPGPGEFGHETWPQDKDNHAWEHGGGAVWQTPAVDPELGLLYFTTGNPGPDLNGSVRKGNNLFTVSMVALDVKTGKYKWHFQQVHHDIWDYDSPNPVILFDAPVKGQMRKGIAEASKTGWVYILDRKTGKPLLGIDEKAVPQEPRQATSATQPYPVGDSFVPQQIDITPEGARLEPGTTHVPNHGRIFTPFWDKEIVVKPSTNGGANWPPSSYDPQTHLMYVCGTDRISTFRVSEKLETPAPGKVYMGGRFGQANVPDGGILAAMDLTTNKLAWRQAWREICYSGSIVTGGGLLFVGRADGRLTALDKSNGDKLWEFMTDAGVNTTVTTFEHKGKQMVAVHAGGGVFANGKRGDGVWMFSLDGTMEPIKAAAPPPRRGGPGGGAAAAAPAPVLKGEAVNGERIYKGGGCVACHGEDGGGGHGGGKTLLLGQEAPLLQSVIANGKNNMPAFSGVYTAAQIADVSAYITDVLQKAKK
ncbi:MAG: PQQ-binding-like beta-propeller repeat protein [Caulobacteraceae bacterium]